MTEFAIHVPTQEKSSWFFSVDHQRIAGGVTKGFENLVPNS